MDGQVSKEAYYEAESSFITTLPYGQRANGELPGGPVGEAGQAYSAASFQRATPSTLASRRFVKPKKLDRRKEYLVGLQV